MIKCGRCPTPPGNDPHTACGCVLLRPHHPVHPSTSAALAVCRPSVDPSIGSSRSTDRTTPGMRSVTGLKVRVAARGVAPGIACRTHLNGSIWLAPIGLPTVKPYTGHRGAVPLMDTDTDTAPGCVKSPLQLGRSCCCGEEGWETCFDRHALKFSLLQQKFKGPAGGAGGGWLAPHPSSEQQRTSVHHAPSFASRAGSAGLAHGACSRPQTCVQVVRPLSRVLHQLQLVRGVAALLGQVVLS